MNDTTSIEDHIYKILRHDLLTHWNSLPESDFDDQLLNLPEVVSAKMQIYFCGVHAVAHIYNMEEAILNNSIPPEFKTLYEHLMKIMPETVKQVALITKYVMEGMPVELILPLVANSDGRLA